MWFKGIDINSTASESGIEQRVQGKKNSHYAPGNFCKLYILISMIFFRYKKYENSHATFNQWLCEPFQ